MTDQYDRFPVRFKVENELQNFADLGDGYRRRWLIHDDQITFEQKCSGTAGGNRLVGPFTTRINA